MSLIPEKAVLFFLCLIFAAFYVSSSTAQETTRDYERRLDLARQVHERHPITIQIEDVLDRLFENLPAEERERTKTDVMANVDTSALELSSVAAMAQIFSVAELQTMIDYYSTPEAASIAEKSPRYRRIVDPQIVDSITDSLSILGMQLGWLQAVPER